MCASLETENVSHSSKLHEIQFPNSRMLLVLERELSIVPVAMCEMVHQVVYYMLYSKGEGDGEAVIACLVRPSLPVSGRVRLEQSEAVTV